MNALARITVALFAAAATFAQRPTHKEAPVSSLVGNVRDKGRLHHFREVIKPCLTDASRRACAGAPQWWSRQERAGRPANLGPKCPMWMCAKSCCHSWASFG